MKRKISITISAFLLIGLALLWLGNRQNSPTADARTSDLTLYTIEMQHSLPARETSKLAKVSRTDHLEMFYAEPWIEAANLTKANHLEMFYAAPWIEERKVFGDRDLEKFYAGPWYNGD